MMKLSFRSIFLFLLLIPMLMFASDVTEGARYGLLLWYNSVVPALFPFMVLSGLIVSGGGISQIMKPFFLVLHPVWGLSEDGCYVLVSGLLCGYPMGAKTCAEFVRDGRISLSEGKFLMAICNHPSPMFLLGFVYPWFQESITIRHLLFCVYVPVVVLAFVAKKIYSNGPANDPFDTVRPDNIRNTFTFKDYKNRVQSKPTSGADAAILSSVEVLCKIGGYLVLFSIAIVLIRKFTWIPESMKLFFIGTLEMTTGIREFGALENWKVGFVASIAALTFGGMSGIFQTKSVLSMSTDLYEISDNSGCKDRSFYEKKAGLSIRPYILWKSVHAGLSAGLAYLLCKCY